MTNLANLRSINRLVLAGVYVWLTVWLFAALATDTFLPSLSVATKVFMHFFGAFAAFFVLLFAGRALLDFAEARPLRTRQDEARGLVSDIGAVNGFNPRDVRRQAGRDFVRTIALMLVAYWLWQPTLWPAVAASLCGCAAVSYAVTAVAGYGALARVREADSESDQRTRPQEF